MNKQIVISTAIVIILIVAIFLFIKGDLSNSSDLGQTNDGTSTTTPGTPEGNNVVGELPNPNAPIPNLDREFVIPEIFGEEIIENTMVQYNELVSALKNDSTLRDEWLQLAILRNAIQDYKGAEEIWVYVTLRWPLDHVAFGNLGNLYLDFLPDNQKAEEFLLLALERNPIILQYTENLYNLYVHRIGEPEKAVAMLDELISTLPREVYFPLKLAEHYRDNGDSKNAIKYFTLSRDVATGSGQQNVIDYANTELEKLQ